MSYIGKSQLGASFPMSSSQSIPGLAMAKSLPGAALVTSESPKKKEASIIRRAMSKYDHSRPNSLTDTYARYVNPWSITKQTFLGAPQIAEQSIRSSAEQGRGCPRPPIFRSKIEKLPPEILLSIFEDIDLESLNAIASVNSNIRRFVRSIPSVAKISQEPLAAEAIARMLDAGTAQDFNLHDFMRAFGSYRCDVCKSLRNSSAGTFATNICLLRCHRVCVSCAMQKHEIFFLPLAMATRCFDLDCLDVANSEGAARARVPVNSNPTKGVPEQNCVYASVEIISMNAAMRLAIAKHGTSTEQLQHIKNLVQENIPSRFTRQVSLSTQSE
jgi:hypothetical protein